MKLFEIVKIGPDGTQEIMYDLPPFTSGKKAKEIAEQLQNMDINSKYQPRPCKTQDGGHQQEGLVPLICLGIIGDRLESQYIDPMYDPKEKVIRYFASDAMKMVSKSTAVDPYRFLSRYFINSSEVYFWLDQQDKNYFDDYTFHITNDEDKIVEIYYKGLDSCMSKRVEFYVNEHEPVRAYAGSDFSLAYLLDKKGNLKARTIVVPSRKIYGRIYGNENIMRIFLNREGYMFGEYDDWAYLKFPTQPATGRYIEGEDDNDEDLDDCSFDTAEGFVAPYIDSIQNGSLSPDMKFFMTDPDGPYRFFCTHGLAEKEEDHDERCGNCGKMTDTAYWHEDENMYYCYKCQSKKHGIRAHDSYPLNASDLRKTNVILPNGKTAVLADLYHYKRCKITHQYFVKKHLPYINNEQLTPPEAEKMYNEHFHILKYAYLPTPRRLDY